MNIGPDRQGGSLMAGGRHAEVMDDAREKQGIGGACSCVVSSFLSFFLTWDSGSNPMENFYGGKKHFLRQSYVCTSSQACLGHQAV